MPSSRSLFLCPPFLLLQPLSKTHLRHTVGIHFKVSFFFFSPTNLQVLSFNSSSACSLWELLSLYSHCDLSQIQTNKSSQQFDRNYIDGFFTCSILRIQVCLSHDIVWYCTPWNDKELFQSETKKNHCSALMPV